MKSEKGITLTSLVIYIIVATILIGVLGMMGSFFYSNMNNVKNKEEYAIEFNKFNMFFIEDIKNNKNAQVEVAKITLENNTIYQYDSSKKVIYRNNTPIAEKIVDARFTKEQITIKNTTKTIIKVYLKIGTNNIYEKEIEYTLKYW